MVVFFVSGLVTISAVDLKKQSNPIFQLGWVPQRSTLSSFLLTSTDDTGRDNSVA